MTRFHGRALPFAFGVVGLVAACDGAVLEVGAFHASGGRAASVGGFSSGPGYGGALVQGGRDGEGTAECRVTQCQSRVYQCGNCLDDDQDGLVDSLDPDCLGVCDNSEATLDVALTGAGANRATTDCYFDHDSGKGNDGCEWDRCCDPLWTTRTECAGTSAKACASVEVQSAECRSVCQPWVPNGCDCFGCCEIRGRTVFVGTAPSGTSACTLSVLDDASKCAPCTLNTSCVNPCERCELCVGKVELPAECGNALPLCPSGITACGVEGLGCSPLEYCLTGCCVAAPQ